jgi:hypothetical protein
MRSPSARNHGVANLSGNPSLRSLAPPTDCPLRVGGALAQGTNADKIIDIFVDKTVRSDGMRSMRQDLRSLRDRDILPIKEDQKVEFVETTFPEETPACISR